MNDIYLEILHDIRREPQKFLRTVSFDETAALLTGIDHVSRGKFLEGFQEWITIQSRGKFSNFFWGVSSLYITFPDFQGESRQTPPPDEDRARNGLLDQVEQFLRDRKAEGINSLREMCQAVTNTWAEEHKDEIFAGCVWREKQTDDEL